MSRPAGRVEIRQAVDVELELVIGCEECCHDLDAQYHDGHPDDQNLAVSPCKTCMENAAQGAAKVLEDRIKEFEDAGRRIVENIGMDGKDADPEALEAALKDMKELVRNEHGR